MYLLPAEFIIVKIYCFAPNSHNNGKYCCVFLPKSFLSTGKLPVLLPIISYKIENFQVYTSPLARRVGAWSHLLNYNTPYLYAK